MNTPPGSPGGRTQVPPASPLEKKGAALFVEVSGEDSDGVSEEDNVYPLQHENPRTTHMKDVQQMHIPRLQLNGMRHGDALDPLGDTAFMPLETPTDLDLDQLFERTDQRTDFNFSHVQIVEEDHMLEPETQEACQEIEYFLERRDHYVFRKPTRYWGGIDRSKMRAKNKGPLGRWRHEPKYAPFDVEIPGAIECTYGIKDGVAHVTIHHGTKGVSRSPTLDPSDPAVNQEELDKENARVKAMQATGDEEIEQPPTMAQFYEDYSHLLRVMDKGSVKTFTHERLTRLQALFHLHVLLNKHKELAAQKQVPHRDFYNVRKVDTHVHHSAIMTQKHLLRFIKHKLKTFPNDKVLKDADGNAMTLRAVFQALGLNAYDLSIDMLDMRAANTFNRFDRFNSKYNPCGESNLRAIFIKTDNLTEGRYLAEVTKQVFDDLKATKYSLSEPRISIYGRNNKEWSRLGAWFCRFKVASFNVRWMIQIPRLYHVWNTNGSVANFQEMLDNIFLPLFKVTADPTSDPDLHLFLSQVTAFDCVDDESKPDPHYTPDNMPKPVEWDNSQNPPFSYWLYYIYSNLYVLNGFRAARGFSTFSFRPHAGEAGPINHLAAAYLLCEQINHGINLNKSSMLQYLFYLKRIGIAVSPLSNNLLFLNYYRNPFYKFYARGLNVSLSTDDPLQLHVTKEPLVEEYCVAAQIWKLSSTDMCEIARNSVLQSGFEHPYKEHFIGANYYKDGPAGNDIHLTNVPDIRIQYRYERLMDELKYVKVSAHAKVGENISLPIARMAASPSAGAGTGGGGASKAGSRVADLRPGAGPARAGPISTLTAAGLASLGPKKDSLSSPRRAHPAAKYTTQYVTRVGLGLHGATSTNSVFSPLPTAGSHIAHKTPECLRFPAVFGDSVPCLVRPGFTSTCDVVLTLHDSTGLCDSILDLANHLHSGLRSGSHLSAASELKEENHERVHAPRTVCIPNLFRRPEKGIPFSADETIIYREKILQGLNWMDMVTDVRSICAHLRAVERGGESPAQPDGGGSHMLGASVASRHGLHSAAGETPANVGEFQRQKAASKKRMRGITLFGVGMGGWLALMCAQHVPNISRVVMLCSDSDPVIAPVAQRLLYAGSLPCPVLLMGGTDTLRENLVAFENAGISTHSDECEGFLHQHALDLHEYLVDPSVVGLSVELKNDIREAIAVLHRFMLE